VVDQKLALDGVLLSLELLMKQHQLIAKKLVDDIRVNYKGIAVILYCFHRWAFISITIFLPIVYAEIIQNTTLQLLLKAARVKSSLWLVVAAEIRTRTTMFTS